MSFGYQVLGFGSGGVSAPYLVATGGTEVTCGDYKTHIFTGDGTFCVSAIGSCAGNNAVDYLVEAGGGGASGDRAGGGGAGGFRTSNSLSLPVASPLANPTGVTVTATGYPITIGAGGAGDPATGTTGVDSTALGLTSAGGGRSASGNTPPIDGGSGGGSYRPGSGGIGNTPPVSPPQGNDGGASPSYLGGGGGGGAAAAGTGTPPAGIGGAGSYIDDTMIGPTAPSYGTPGPVGSTRYFAGGGGGGAYQASGNPGGVGGGGPGGRSGGTPPVAGTAATVNTGGGGGGGSTFGPGMLGGAGGSGVVIIRYKYQ